MGFCRSCGAQLAGTESVCTKCGAGLTATAGGTSAAATASQPVVPQPAQQRALIPAPPQYPAAGSYGAPPPGMVAVMYQPYPGGPQQVYYVPAQGTQAHAGTGFLESIQAQIRSIAGTDKLEGFSLGQTFSEALKQHGPDAADEYAMCGSPRTTPPIELVDTNWPRPWMFFRLLAALVAASLVLYAAWYFLGLQAINVLAALLIVAAFAVPVAVLVFIFEMNTPRNVSVVTVGKLFVLGGVLGCCMALLEYQIKPIANWPGPIEEFAKLLAVVLLVRSTRYKYELNGILFGCAVGAGFGSFETCGYALFSSGGFVPVLQSETIQVVIKFAQGQMTQTQAVAAINGQVFLDAANAFVHMLLLRGALAPFMHVVWSSIAVGAFWRVKQDKPTSVSMFMDTRFLMAFLIPVLMHTLWDLTLTFPHLFNPQTQSQANTDGYILYGIMAFTGLVSWYVLFTMIQQGLNQVRDVKAAQLRSTLTHLEATLPPVPAVGTYAVRPLA